MPKIKNISSSVYRLQGQYLWQPGETLDVPDKVAAHVMEAQAGRFELVEGASSQDQSNATTVDRKQRNGRFRKP